MKTIVIAKEVTVTVQIGNSDDKLTQSEWADYVQNVNAIIMTSANEVHFQGYSPGNAMWQNAAWVFTLDSEYEFKLKDKLEAIKEPFKQDHIAYVSGNVEFI